MFARVRFTTIEQKLSGVRRWYDKQLKNYERLANPLRNERGSVVMGTLEKQLGRAVAHKPKMLKEMHLRAVQGEVQSLLCASACSEHVSRAKPCGCAK